MGRSERVLQFGKIDLCPTIEEYSKILEVPYIVEFVVAPLFNQGF